MYLEKTRINTEVYNRLGDRWYDADDDPVALLRAESHFRNPWILSQIQRHFSSRSVEALDVACGAGFLSNFLVRRGHRVTGVDLSKESLSVARKHDVTGRVRYLTADAHDLPFPEGSFEVVCLMDFLEHTDRPQDAIREAARVTRPGGLIFFHTFNRNALSWLLVIKGVEWFVRNTPSDLHTYPLFITPSEMRAYLDRASLSLREWFGVRPSISTPFWKMLFTRKVPANFTFVRANSLFLGYTGCAEKGMGVAVP